MRAKRVTGRRKRLINYNIRTFLRFVSSPRRSSGPPVCVTHVVRTDFLFCITRLSFRAFIHRFFFYSIVSGRKTDTVAKRNYRHNTMARTVCYRTRCSLFGGTRNGKHRFFFFFWGGGQSFLIVAIILINVVVYPSTRPSKAVSRFFLEGWGQLQNIILVNCYVLPGVVVQSWGRLL